MQSRTTKLIIIGVTGLALAGWGAMPAFAAATSTARRAGFAGYLPGAIGTVESVSGTTITLLGKNGTTYQVNAAGATVLKSTSLATKPATASLAAIAVGDHVAVMGAVSGTTVTATKVIDAPLQAAKPHFAKPATTGRVVGGTVSAISGLTLTLEPKARHHATTTPAAITVDTSATTVISRNGQQISLTDIAAGSEAIVSGTHNADGSLEATKIIVRTPKMAGK